MAVTIEADFDPLQAAVTLELYAIGIDVAAYTLALTEKVVDKGSYGITGVVAQGRYRTALKVGGVLVQRSRIQVGPNTGGVYAVGNWEGSIDISTGFYPAGIGAFTITLTVNDNLNNPIEGAFVSLYRGGDQRNGVTDVNGQVVFNSDAVTWTTVAISVPGFTFVTAPIVVTANTAITYTGVVVIYPAPASAAQVHVQAPVYDEYGIPENGVVVSVKMIQPYTVTGFYDSKIATFTSAAGVVTMTNLFQGATYEIWRGRATPMKYVVPVTALAVVDCDPILGDDTVDPCL